MERRSRLTLNRWIVVAIAAAAILMIVAAVVLWVPGGQHRRSRSRATKPATPTETSATTKTAATTGTAEPTSTTPAPSKLKSWTSNALIPFVRDGELWMAREDGRGRRRRVVKLGEMSTYLISPNRRRVAYTQQQGRRKPLFVAELYGNRTYRVAEDTDAFQGFAFAWSPSNDRLVYTVPAHSGSVRTGERLETVAFSGRNRKHLVGQAGAPVWGPRGKICFRRVDVAHGTWRLWTVDADGGAPKRVPSSSQATSYGWAPRQADLAFAITQSKNAGGLSIVWVLKEGETSPQPLLQEKLNKARYSNIAWSPEGRLIAVEVAGDDGYSRVTVVNAAGMNVSWQVRPERDDYLLGWSIDGSRLLYFEGNVFQGAPSNLWSVKRNGTSRRVVVTDAGRQ